MAKKTSVASRDSRYVQGGITYTRPTRISWWERTNFKKREDDIVLTITPQHSKRPDKLAYDLYGKSTLMWLVLQYNNIVDINLEFITGKEIKLPSKRRVSLELLNNSTGGTRET